MAVAMSGISTRGELTAACKLVSIEVVRSEKTHQYDKCSFLIMSSIKITQKLVRTLARGGFVVTPAWLNQMLELCARKGVVKQSLLPPKKFVPEMSKEEVIVLTPEQLLPCSTRRTLFKGMTFLWTTEQSKHKSHESLEMIVKDAGGRMQLYDEQQYR